VNASQQPGEIRSVELFPNRPGTVTLLDFATRIDTARRDGPELHTGGIASLGHRLCQDDIAQNCLRALGFAGIDIRFSREASAMDHQLGTVQVQRIGQHANWE